MAKFIVVKKGITLGLGDKKKSYDIGDAIDLTKAQAANLSGKVRSQREVAEEGKSDKQLKAENTKLTKNVAELNDELEKSKAAFDELEDAFDKSGVKVAELTEQLAKLTEQLTAAPAAKTK